MLFITLPPNNEAVPVLRGEASTHASHVFIWQGRPVNKANTHAWRQAMKRVGIESFRWHDLRHTWASWHLQNAVSVTVANRTSLKWKSGAP